jgi:hypothetical protein
VQKGIKKEQVTVRISQEQGVGKKQEVEISKVIIKTNSHP